MNGPWDFWNNYYVWAIQSPTLAGQMDRLRDGLIEIQITIADHFTPVIRKVARAFEDLGFTIWLGQQPRWQRPFMRLAYRIERLVLR